MPPDPLSNAVGTALTTIHRTLACGSGEALRYPAHIAPFAAVRTNTATAFQDLHRLLIPGETVYVQGDQPPQATGLLWQGVIPCLQLVFPAETPLPAPLALPRIEPLDCRHGPEMMNLIAVAYPGYFRPETCRMGRYFGIRDDGGHLIAMGGERLCCAVPGSAPWHEISGLCSHPAHAGKGLGTAILRNLLAVHRAEGSRSWLWVAESNRRAVALYLHLGFVTHALSRLHRLQRGV